MEKMKLIQREAKVFLTDCECPKCKNGAMVGGQVLPGKIDKTKVFVIHKCTKCDNIMQFENIKYPKIEFMPFDVYEEMKKKEAEGKKEDVKDSDIIKKDNPDLKIVDKDG